ncbi:hypothetical protein [Longimonas halophila]|uniref:hypothetical protein n=1 Tax=Longimonas halophila TaxID=1469170 RepID=UPI001144AB5E|nr:hypothetical protein [Longimonas halophila]
MSTSYNTSPPWRSEDAEPSDQYESDADTPRPAGYEPPRVRSLGTLPESTGMQVSAPSNPPTPTP